MQTFLPYRNFEASAKILDTVRLNKQLLECRQMFSAMAGQSKFGAHHPATKMWTGHQSLLWDYVLAVREELDRRGTPTQKNMDAAFEFYHMLPTQRQKTYPEWYDEREQMLLIETTHRASLYNKNQDHYRNFLGEALMVNENPQPWMCCPVGTHAVYYYPTHVKA
jgi:hypothetical protein